VVTDPAAGYFGAVIDGGSIVPGGGATLFETSFTETGSRPNVTNAAR
jgi:hypothetical protein